MASIECANPGSSDVGDADFLAEQAVAASVFADIEEAKTWLASNAKMTVRTPFLRLMNYTKSFVCVILLRPQEVAKEIREAQMMGITGVPFFVLNKVRR